MLLDIASDHQTSNIVDKMANNFHESVWLFSSAAYPNLSLSYQLPRVHKLNLELVCHI